MKSGNAEVLERVRKLLAVANDGAATEGEAQAALGRVAHLALQYGLSDLELHSVRRESGSEVSLDTDQIVEEVVWRVGRTLNRWDRGLGVAAATACSARMYLGYEDGCRCIYFYGLPTDVAVGRELFGYLRETLSRSAKEWARDQRKAGRHRVQGNSVAVRSFKDGFCSAVIKRSRDDAEEAAQTTKTVEQAGALVPICAVVSAKVSALDEWGRRSSVQRDRQSFEEGTARGSQMRLGRRSIG